MIDRNTTSPFGSKIGASSLILLTALNRDLLELGYSHFPVHQSKFLGHNRALTWSWGLHTLRKIKKLNALLGLHIFMIPFPLFVKKHI
jgi:hypothetical protein